MAQQTRKFFGLKATEQDEKQIAAIVAKLGVYANASDALRAAVQLYVRKHRLDWQSVKLADPKPK